ncbi:MAG: PBP1A family penicillin-binding protein [Myxococcales bacterium]
MLSMAARLPGDAPDATGDAEPYRPVPADDYQGNLASAPPAAKTRLRRAISAALLLVAASAISLVLAAVLIAREIPAMESVRDYQPFVATKVVTQDGAAVGNFFREKRTVVRMDQVPQVLVQAVISAEDKDFYKHPGFNLLAMVRAVVVDALSGRKRLGASTITQQVVKNFFLTPDKKLKRKLKELILAARLERNLSKDDILFLYLNQINFGKAHYGVEEAALYYFGKHVGEIRLGEAALIAGLPQNPSRLNPRRHPDNAKRRQVYVLDRMLANHYIGQKEHDAEVARPLLLPPVPEDPPGAWYLDEVRRQLIAQFGQSAVETAGMTVEVAMDVRLQAAAEQAVQEGLRAVDKRQGYRGPLAKVARNKVGELLAGLGTLIEHAAPVPDALLVADLGAIAERGPIAPDAAARSARVRPLSQDRLYAGVVTAVGAHEARVALGPGAEGSVPFSTMGWARRFKPEGRTAAPGSPADVVAVGDVIEVRATRVELARDRPGPKRLARLDLSLEQRPLVQGAFAAIDPKTRGVLALVGGYQYDADKSAFNRATQAKRQPGSAFKPFLYAAALDTGKFTPITRVDDSPEVINDPWTGKAWKPQNFEKDEFAGRITLREALAQSKNTVAVKLLIDLGLDKVRAQARAAGLSSDIPQSFTAALGTGEVGILELINAYTTLDAQGRRASPVLIRKVTARDGSLMLAARDDAVQEMRPETAYLTADLMRSVIDSNEGTAHSLSALERPVAGKTGTASEHRDGWFIGFTPSLVAGGWVGFDDHRLMGSYETGGHCAGPIWLSWTRAALLDKPVEPWPAPPPGVTELRVNRNTGLLARENDPFGVREVFMAGTEPTAEHQALAPDQGQFYQEGR